MTHNTYCDCTGSAPWPVMVRLSVGGLNRYSLCYECERVREEVMTPAGVVVDTRYHDLASETLSRAAREQAEESLRLRGYEQGSLFGEG